MNRFWSKVRKTKTCWLWTASKDSSGYGKFGVGKYPKGRWRKAHRIAYELEIGDIPEGMCVLHRCDHPACVNPAHLFLGTNADNMRDKIGKKRHRIGSANTMAKLNERAVRVIRSSNEFCTTLARRYGCSFQTVWKARMGLTWKHV